MVSERRSGPLPLVPVPLLDVTVTAEDAVTGPVNAVALAVMVVVPGAFAVTNPAALTVATDGVVEDQVTMLVTLFVDKCDALPYVPTAFN